MLLLTLKYQFIFTVYTKSFLTNAILYVLLWFREDFFSDQSLLKGQLENCNFSRYYYIVLSVWGEREEWHHAIQVMIQILPHVTRYSTRVRLLSPRDTAPNEFLDSLLIR